MRATELELLKEEGNKDAQFTPGEVLEDDFQNINNVNFPKLTNRQTECLYYLAKGLAPKQIARLFDISSRTVEHHIAHLKNKFKCYSRSNLISKAFEIPAIKIRLLTN